MINFDYRERRKKRTPFEIWKDGFERLGLRVQKRAKKHTHGVTHQNIHKTLNKQNKTHQAPYKKASFFLHSQTHKTTKYQENSHHF